VSELELQVITLERHLSLETTVNNTHLELKPSARGPAPKRVS
jgi:hypothetical protein